jgi:rhodanese-related sulfurtransferase
MFHVSDLMQHMTKLRGTGIVLLLGVLVTASLAACAPQQGAAATPIPAADAAPQTTAVAVASGSYTNVGASGLNAMLKAKTFPLINVHVPYEGEIAGTDLFIPYNEIDKYTSQLPSDKGARIVLYCRSGRMSDIAARALVGMGYSDVWNLDRGMIAWQAAGYPLLEKQQP